MYSLREALSFEGAGSTSFKFGLAGYPPGTPSSSQPIGMFELITAVYWPHIRLEMTVIGANWLTPDDYRTLFETVQGARGILWTQNRALGIGRLVWRTIDVSRGTAARSQFMKSGGQPSGFRPEHGGRPTLCNKPTLKLLELKTLATPLDSTCIRVFLVNSLYTAGVSLGAGSGMIVLEVAQRCDPPVDPPAFRLTSQTVAHELGHQFGLHHDPDTGRAVECMTLPEPKQTTCAVGNLMTQVAAGGTGTELLASQKSKMVSWMEGGLKSKTFFLGPPELVSGK